MGRPGEISAVAHEFQDLSHTDQYRRLDRAVPAGQGSQWFSDRGSAVVRAGLDQQYSVFGDCAGGHSDRGICSFCDAAVQSILNPLKYFNLFSYIQTSKLYTQYLNIDLFGYPFGIRTLALWALPFLLALFLFGALWVQRNRYPAGNRDWLSKFAHLVNRALIWDGGI